jgi:hypothetical protein
MNGFDDKRRRDLGLKSLISDPQESAVDPTSFQLGLKTSKPIFDQGANSTAGKPTGNQPVMPEKI